MECYISLERDSYTYMYSKHDRISLIFPADFDEHPLSLNASLGSTAVFQCEVYDKYGLYREISIFWLVRNSTSGYNFSFQYSSGEIIIDEYCWGPYYCYTFLKIPASDLNNNTEIQCQASFDICPDDLQSSSIATLHIQGI